MELTYTNHNLIEQGVIQDFTIDLAFGKDENDFEIVTSENVLQQGFYWYVPDTEYGGVVDDIEGTTNAHSIIYRGRSWQGILASYFGWQLKSNDLIVVHNDTIEIHATPYDLAKSIIDQLGIDIKVEIPTTDQTVLNETVDRGLDIYQLMRYVFEKNAYKVSMYWEDGIVLNITGAIDYTSDLYFDMSQYTVKVDKKSIPNHLIGVFKREEQDNIIKHLYADENGVIQPYYVLDTNHDQPKHDYEYERVEGEPILTGLNERVEVIEGGSKIENYDVVTELTEDDGNTEYENGIPKDWNENCYTDYYYLEIDEETGDPKYQNFKIENEDVPFTVQNPLQDYEVKTLDWWSKNWMNCFKREESGDLKQLSTSDCPVVPRYEEIRWNQTNREYFRQHYSEYYYRVSDPNNYAQIEGKQRYKWQVQTNKGSYWNTNTGEFYFDWVRRKWKVDHYNNKGKKVKTSWVYEYNTDGTPTTKTFNVWSMATTSGHKESKSLSEYKQFNGGNITKNTKIYSTKDGKKAKNVGHIVVHKSSSAWSGRISIDTYCAISGKKIEDVRKNRWKANTYYLRVEDTPDLPDTLPNPIYRKVDVVQSYPPITEEGTPLIYFYQEDIEKPTFIDGATYRKVEDNYTNLVEKMIEEYDKIKAQASVIEPQIDTEIAEFDVGDIIGGTHPFTHELLTSAITKKIVKGGTKGLTVSYEIG